MARIIFIDIEYSRSCNSYCLDPFFQPSMAERREIYLDTAWIEPQPSAWQASAVTITPRRPFGLTQLLVKYSPFLSTCSPVVVASVEPVGCQGSVVTSHEVEVGLRRREQVHLQQLGTELKRRFDEFHSSSRIQILFRTFFVVTLLGLVVK